MITGMGQLHFVTNDLSDGIRGEELFFDLCVASFAFAPNETKQEARCLKNGRVQRSSSAITEQLWTLTLEFEEIGWDTMQLASDELASTVSNVSLPQVKNARIDTNGEVLDADITALSADSILVYLAGKPPVFMNAVAVAPVAANEVQIDTANNKLVFDSSLVGRNVSYSINKAYSSIDSIGVADEFDRFGTISFRGVIAGTNFNEGAIIVIPELYRASTPELNISGDLTTLTMEYDASVPFGKRLPYEIYNLDTAVV